MYYVHGAEENPPAVLLTHVTQYLQVLLSTKGRILFEALFFDSLFCGAELIPSQLLAGLAKDPESEVRKLVCQSLVSLLDRAGAHMLPGLHQLTEFFLYTCQHDPSDDVVLAACEYWSALCQASAFEDEDVKDYIISLFPR
jgi:hypothetical protein